MQSRTTQEVADAEAIQLHRAALEVRDLCPAQGAGIYLPEIWQRD